MELQSLCIWYFLLHFYQRLKGSDSHFLKNKKLVEQQNGITIPLITNSAQSW